MSKRTVVLSTILMTMGSLWIVASILRGIGFIDLFYNYTFVLLSIVNSILILVEE